MPICPPCGWPSLCSYPCQQFCRPICPCSCDSEGDNNNNNNDDKYEECKPTTRVYELDDDCHSIPSECLPQSGSFSCEEINIDYSNCCDCAIQTEGGCDCEAQTEVNDCQEDNFVDCCQSYEICNENESENVNVCQHTGIQTESDIGCKEMEIRTLRGLKECFRILSSCLGEFSDKEKKTCGPVYYQNNESESSESDSSCNCESESSESESETEESTEESDEEEETTESETETDTD